MNEQNDPRIYNAVIAFRASSDFNERFEAFVASIGRGRSAIARYLLAQCMTAYESDHEAIMKIRQSIF